MIWGWSADSFVGFYGCCFGGRVLLDLSRSRGGYFGGMLLGVLVDDVFGVDC